ncbi:hypothetical protein [uncultured Sphingomonas sp.]|uniref:hypothetical protein n=1 Tax=uncultured Sphingomonas sp. TaxID=158754 RepID=UPI0035CB4E24
MATPPGRNSRPRTTARRRAKSSSPAARRGRTEPAKPTVTAKRGLAGLAAVALALGGGLIARTLLRGRRNPAEHVPDDLLRDTCPVPGDRAPDAFRPDPTAPVPNDLRDSLRPATIPID